MYKLLNAKFEEMRPGMTSSITVDGVGHYVSKLRPHCFRTNIILTPELIHLLFFAKLPHENPEKTARAILQCLSWSPPAEHSKL